MATATAYAPVDLARAELERRRRLRERQQVKLPTPPPFGEWLASTDDQYRWTAPHFRVMQETLDRVTRGELTRVIFTVPVRHGKTEHNTYRYIAYRFAHKPTLRVLLASYNDDQVRKFSRDIRRRVMSLPLALSTDRAAASEWETTAGGSLRAVGAGAGTASINADLIVIDDPIGRRADAESAAIRESLWDWLTNDILPRAEPHTAVILTASQYHGDDVTARLLDRQKGQWHRVWFPAIAESDDALGRKEGEALWPELRPLAWLENQRSTVGAYGFASLYQGRPRPREGAMFQWDWFWEHRLDVVPSCSRYVRYWDLAGTQPRDGKHDPDFSAGTLIGRMHDQRAAILHQSAFRLGVAARDAKLEELARADKAKYPNVVWWLESETGIGGKERTQAIVRRTQACGVAVHTELATGSKADRAEPLQSAAEAGNVCLGPDDPVNPWHDAFCSEAIEFPGGTHDDRVDSAAGAYNKIALRSPDVVYSFIA